MSRLPDFGKKLVPNTPKTIQYEAELAEVNPKTLRKQKYREKQKILKMEKLAEPGPLIAAKKLFSNFIKENPESDPKTFIEQQRLALDAKQFILLKKAIQYQAKTNHGCQHSKNLKSDPSQSDSMQMTLSKVTEINLRLCNITEPDQLESEVQDLLKNDIWGIIAYVKSNKPTQQNMLGAIVKGCTQEINEQNCELFVQLCKNANIFHLDVSGPLVEAAMRYLNKNLENDAILGLLRFVLSNSLSLTEFDLATVTNFQDRYCTAIESFFNQNPKFRYSNKTPFPPTLFCFTEPLLNQIMSCSDEQMLIFKNFHLIFQTELLHIIGYSFNDKEDDLRRFMELFTLLTMNHNKLLHDMGFLDLLKAMTQHALLKEEGYFRTLRKPTDIFDQILCLATERKLPRFDDNFIDNLLKHEKHFISALMNAPRMLEQKSNSTLKNFLVGIQKNNKDIEFDQSYLCSQLSVDDQSLVEAIKLTHLLPSQHLLYKYCLQQHNYTCYHPALNFFQLDTGQGKTALCRLLGFNWADNGEVVIILNNSVELTLRDCFDSGQLAQVLDLKVLQLSKKLLQADLHEQLSHGGIMYATSETFFSLIQDINQDLISSATFIIDEFDSLLFEDVNLANQCVKFFHQISRLYCFSGSLFLKQHINFLKEYCDSPLLNFSLMKSEKTQLKCHTKVAFTNQKDQLKRIKEQCEQLKLYCPTIIVAPEQHKKLTKSLQTKTGASVEDIVKATPESVDSTLKHFLDKHQDMYKIVIVSSQQARGLDFWTNDQVEKCGGVNLIIAELPMLFLHYQQYLGRIGRIGMQGQYSVIIKHNDAPPNNDQNWVQQQLDILEKNEFGRMLQFRIDAPKIQKEMILVETEEELKGDEQINSEQFVNGSIESEQESEEFFINTCTKKGLVQEKPEVQNNQEEMSEGQTENNEGLEMVVIDKNKEDSKLLELPNSANESNEHFEGQGLNDKLVEVLKKQNKRKQKETTKLNLKLNKLLEEKEECKFCGDQLIEPHVCRQTKENVGSLQLEPNQNMEIEGQNAMAQRNDGWESDEFIPKEDEVMLKNSGLAFKENLIAEKNIYSMVQSAKKDDGAVKNDQMTTCKPTINLTKRQTKSLKDQTAIQQSIDQRYYAGYSKKDIHKDMLKDKVRVKTYAKAIEQQCKDKQVLDVGSGSGVLSGYALMVGAKEVYGVDKANVKKIMDNQLNKMKVDDIKESMFIFVNDTIESTAAKNKIPQVDVVVSEWMGYFLLFENMIGSYIFAIENFLKPNGIMIPSQANMFINAAAYQSRIPSKFKQGLAITDIYCKTTELISDPTNIKKIDFMDRANLVNPLDEGFASDFKIVVTKAGEFNVFIGSFDAQLAEDILLDTSPVSPQTHWKQSLFFITKPIQVSKGDIIQGSVKVNADEVNYRNLIVEFTYKVEGKGASVEEHFTFE